MKPSPKYTALYKECGIALGTWLLVLVFLLVRHTSAEVIGYLVLVPPYAILLYWLCYKKIIPHVLAKGQDFKIYLLWVIGIIALTFIPIIGVTSKVAGGLHLFAGIFTLVFQLIFTAPLAWEVYRHRLRSSGEIARLRTALGKSDTNYQFLQSQINPHFLFNTLNTLLGTAMQEHAERTGEGIQRLGDMMRFMLHENVKEFIPLNREIDYVRHYIALQKLRIKNSPDIAIQVMIEDPADGLEIMPMLIIPFVENAFKHGISLRSASHIDIDLQTREKVLYLSVGNSIHHKDQNDPEKEHSGIGLKNLKQRLQLVYPKRHELHIQETERVFLVSLRLELTDIPNFV